MTGDDPLLLARALVLHDLAARGLADAETVSVLETAVAQRRWWLSQWDDGAPFVAGLVAQEAFGALRAPIQQVTGPHTPVPFADSLEDLFIPDATRIAAAVKTVADYGR